MVDSQPRRIMRGREDFREGGFLFPTAVVCCQQIGV